MMKPSSLRLCYRQSRYMYNNGLQLKILEDPESVHILITCIGALVPVWSMVYIAPTIQHVRSYIAPTQVHNSEVSENGLQSTNWLLHKLQMEEQETETYSTHIILPSLVTYNQACIHQTLTKRRSVASAKERSISCCM